VFTAAFSPDGRRFVIVGPALDAVAVCRYLALARCVVVSGHGYTHQLVFTIHKYAPVRRTPGKSQGLDRCAYSILATNTTCRIYLLSTDK